MPSYPIHSNKSKYILLSTFQVKTHTEYLETSTHLVTNSVLLSHTNINLYVVLFEHTHYTLNPAYSSTGYLHPKPVMSHMDGLVSCCCCQHYRGRELDDSSYQVALANAFYIFNKALAIQVALLTKQDSVKYITNAMPRGLYFVYWTAYGSITVYKI